MAISFERLEALEALLRIGQFSTTAKALHLTQPALSQRIQALEEACGARLVVRAKPVRPTAEGAIVLRYAKRVLAEMEDLRRELADLQSEAPSGRLRVAASSAWGFYVLPPILRRFRTDVPELDIDLVAIGNSSQISDAVRNGEADVAVGVIGDPSTKRDLSFIPLLTDEWYLVSSPLNAKLADLLEVPARLLRDECVIMREPGSGTRTMLEDVLQTEGVRPSVTLQFTSTEAVKRAVQAGLGVSVIAGAAIGAEVRAGTLRAHRFVGRRLTFSYYAATAVDRYAPAGLKVFLRALRDIEPAAVSPT